LTFYNSPSSDDHAMLNYFQYSENLLNLKTKNPTPELAKKFEEFHANAPRRQGCSALDQVKFLVSI